jgi:hypothetical protein
MAEDSRTKIGDMACASHRMIFTYAARMPRVRGYHPPAKSAILIPLRRVNLELADRLRVT